MTIHHWLLTAKAMQREINEITDHIHTSDPGYPASSPANDQAQRLTSWILNPNAPTATLPAPGVKFSIDEQPASSPKLKRRLINRQVTIQEINDPPMPNTFDVTVEYPSDGLPEWFAPLQPVLEDRTVDSMDIMIGGGRVRYHITMKQAEEESKS